MKMTLLRCSFVMTALVSASCVARAQNRDETKWEFKAAMFQSEDAGTKKLNELAADGWTYVGPLGNGLVAFKRPLPPAKSDRRVMRIHNYDYELPSWWDSVKVTVPRELARLEDVSKYVKERYGKEVGTHQTWKEALKTWALWCEANDYSPDFVAHCHVTGGEHRRAAEIYVGLYHALEKWPKLDAVVSEQCLLAYEAGDAYSVIGDLPSAKKWLGRAAELVGKLDDDAGAYYAKKAAEMLRDIDAKEKVVK
jgi:hypothetical protein